MPRAKLSDAKPVNPIDAPDAQGGKAKLSDVTPADDYDHRPPTMIGAPPPFGSAAWFKTKAYGMLNGTVDALPTILGTAGGMFGAGVGEGINPAGGGVPGAIIGSGFGGSTGDAIRQFSNHATGRDRYEPPKTMGARVGDAALEGAGQAVGEATGMLAGKWMRPTLERSIAKLSHAGNISYGDGMGEGRLKTVIDDLTKTEKASGGKATTVKDFVNVIGQTLKDVGARADASLDKPVRIVNGQPVKLRDLTPNPTPLTQLITDFATKDAGMVKRASLAGGDSSVTDAKKYMQMVKDRELTFQQKPWTYGELAGERIRINNELSSYYGMTPGEKQAFLKDHPLFEVDKKIAEYIRDVTYPEMDKAAGYPLGTTKALQERRGILMGIDTEVRKNLEALQTKTMQAKGEGVVDKISPSGYLTSEGKPGGSVHRVQRLIHTPDGIASADKKVSQAFGHAPLTKLRKGLTTPLGSEKIGNELLSLPLRYLVNPSAPNANPLDKDDDDPGPQSSMASPKDLIEQAKQRANPAATGQVAYDYHAVHPQTGHHVISRDGRVWIDPNTGQQVG